MEDSSNVSSITFLEIIILRSYYSKDIIFKVEKVSNLLTDSIKEIYINEVSSRETLEQVILLTIEI